MKIDLQLYFQIRDQDGLLQRYLTRNTGKWGITRQGAMMSYWFHGNNASFVLLLSLIAQAVVCRELIHEGDAHSDKEAVEMAHDFFSSAYDFYESFADDAHNVWNMVTSPFSRATKAEINDFIEDDESVLAEEEVNAMSHRALHMKAELEKFRDQHADAQILAARYEHLEGAVDPDDGDGFDPEGNQSDSECQSEEEIAGREYDSSEVEDDDWQKSILDKRVAKRKSQIPLDRSRRRVSLSDSKMSLPKQSHPVCTLTQMQSSDEEDEFVPPTSAGRRRLAIQDSDDD